ncbi:MAG: deoxyribose-phosphate aldolase [Bacteroidetes bacterium]|nr:deoxyribose-phosphate aldolase [Bacteroidota bacterium]
MKNELYSIGNLKTLFGLIDLTSLNSTDTEEKIMIMCLKVNGFNKQYPDIPNVAAICIYPSLVNIVRKNLKAPGVKIASVSAGFPSSQTFTEIKKTETMMALEAGADEIDIVISLGKFLSGKEKEVSSEIYQIKKIMGNHPLKVILETGALNPHQISKASILAMESGADFIKTSTGKLQPAATTEAFRIMAESIRDFTIKTGRKTGIKPAGGISTGEQAVKYLEIIKKVLGENWITPDLFRIGASKLVNNLLKEISQLENPEKEVVPYF